MPSYKVTRKTQEDLIAIGQHTQRKWGTSQRKLYLKQLDRCFSKLSANPKLGNICNFIAKGYRKFPQGSHVIFYRKSTEGTVEIIRVLHKSMDVGPRF